MSYFAGIDLHKRYLTLCVLNPDGNVVVQHRRLTTDGLVPVLAELDGPITVAVEATLHWAWLHDRLVAQGYAVKVADPGQVKLICKARCKTDPIDARKLAARPAVTSSSTPCEVRSATAAAVGLTPEPRIDASGVSTNPPSARCFRSTDLHAASGSGIGRPRSS